jgi:hypothetical protein
MFWRVNTSLRYTYAWHVHMTHTRIYTRIYKMLLSVNAIIDTASGHFLHQLSRQWGMWPEASHAAGSPAPHLSVPHRGRRQR